MNIKVKIYSQEDTTTIETTPNKKISEILGISDHSIDAPCGGIGSCGKCRVFVKGEVSSPTEAEFNLLGHNLEKAMRLACLTYALGDCEVTLTKNRDNEFNIGFKDFIPTAFSKKPIYKNYGIAIDIGTTTIAAKLLQKGNIIASTVMKNPQTAFGSDVISRIGFAIDGNGEKLAISVKKGLQNIISDLTKSVNISSREIDAGVITGNTTMLYLLTNRNPLSLSAAPFKADWLAGQWISATSLGFDFAESTMLYLPRCISAFVGADITTAILASGITNCDEVSLLIDIGTNGEVALWKEGSLICCSTAAGPALEGAGVICGIHGINGAIDTVSVIKDKVEFTVIGGGEPEGICGSGIIDGIAVMLDLDVLDENGCISEEYSCENISDKSNTSFFKLKDEIGIYGQDIRSVQLAKSAICSGIETLITQFNVNPTKLYIAGGFGNHINIKNATKIGLIPAELSSKALPIGNAALSGAVMLLSDLELISKSEVIAESAITMDLSTNPIFFEKYVDNMIFEKVNI